MVKEGMKFVFLLEFLFVFLLKINAEDIHFEYLNKENGLSSNPITAIIQDSLGFFWIGTETGLSRYDGYEFLNFYSNSKDNCNSLINNNITCFSLDKDNLFIGSIYGISKLNLHSYQFSSLIFHENDLINRSQENQINSILNVDNTIWIASNRGVKHILSTDFKNPLFKDYYKAINQLGESIDLGEIKNINCDKDGNIYFGGKNGIFLKKRGSNNIVQINTNSNNVLYIDKNNKIWFADSDNIYICNLNSNAQISQINPLYFNSTESIIRCTFINTDGENIWIGTEGNGLYQYNGNEFLKHSSSNIYSINNDFVHCCFYNSKNQSLWFGTDAGINWCYKKNNFNTLKRLPYVKENIKLENVHSIFVNDNIWLIGTKNNGLFIIDNKRKKSNHFKTNSFNAIKTIAQTKDHFFFIGTAGAGLFKIFIDSVSLNVKIINQYKPVQNNSESFASLFVNAICEGENGDLWIATMNGLCKYDYQDNKQNINRFQTYTDNSNNEESLKNNQIYSLYKSEQDNSLWIGLLNWGLGKMYFPFQEDSDNEKQKDKSLFFLDYTSRISNTNEPIGIYSIYESNKKQLWLGTNHGLIRYSIMDNISVHYNLFISLLGENIYGILPDEQGNLWLSSSNGLCRFNIRSEEAKPYYQEDGLQSNEFNGGAFFRTKNNILFFGGQFGINWFNPENINPRNDENQKVFFTKLEVMGKKILLDNKIIKDDISYTKEIHVPYNKNSLKIYFSPLDFNLLKHRNYQYKLSSNTDQWINIETDNFISINSLQPGKYTLFVRCMNRNGLWSRNESKLAIVVMPPLWKTSYAISLYVIILILIVSYILYLIYQRILLKNNLKLLSLAKEIDDKNNELKMQFFTNLSHELRTPLTMIMSPLESIIKSVKNGESIDKSLLNVVHKNSSKLNQMIEQLIVFRKISQTDICLHPEKKDIIHFIEVIFQSYLCLFQDKSIVAKFKSEQNSLLMWFDPDKMEKILNNLLSNALKYTPVGGNVSLFIHVKTDNVEILLKDNGIGISENDLPLIFNRFYQSKSSHYGFGIGLYLVKQLILLHHGKISVASKVGKGSLFTIIIPLNIEYHEEKSDEYKRILSQYECSNMDLTLNLPSVFNNESTIPKILLVDDNLDLLNYLKNQLSSHYNVICADNGLDAYFLACKKRPNMIICDASMSKMNGYELCKKIRSEDSPLKDVFFIMLSTQSIEECQRLGKGLEINKYLSKPFQIDIIQDIINEYLQNKDVKKEKDIAISSKSSDTSISYEDEFLDNFKGIIYENLQNESLNVEYLAEKLHMDRSSLYRKIKSLTGSSPTDLIRQFRMHKAADMLSQNRFRINEISNSIGITDIQYFSKSFKKYYGITPSEYAKKHKSSY